MIAMRWLSKAIKICEKQEIQIEERRVRKKKKMPGEHAEDVGLSAVEEIKRGMLEAMDQFRSEAEKRFSEICMLNQDGPTSALLWATFQNYSSLPASTG